jgi:hypothetical protein
MPIIAPFDPTYAIRHDLGAIDPIEWPHVFRAAVLIGQCMVAEMTEFVYKRLGTTSSTAYAKDHRISARSQCFHPRDNQ